jgi:hypothetical protein
MVGVVSASLVGLCGYAVLARHFKQSEIGRSAFHLPSGRRIYVVATDDWTDNWSDADDDSEHIVEDPRAKRIAREEFAKQNKITVTDSERDADFVFLLVVDPKRSTRGVVAEVDTPGCVSKPSVRCESMWHVFGDSPAEVVQLFCRDVLETPAPAAR